MNTLVNSGQRSATANDSYGLPNRNSNQAAFNAAAKSAQSAQTNSPASRTRTSLLFSGNVKNDNVQSALNQLNTVTQPQPADMALIQSLVARGINVRNLTPKAQAALMTYAGAINQLRAPNVNSVAEVQKIAATTGDTVVAVQNLRGDGGQVLNGFASTDGTIKLDSRLSKDQLVATATEEFAERAFQTIAGLQADAGSHLKTATDEGLSKGDFGAEVTRRVEGNLTPQMAKELRREGDIVMVDGALGEGDWYDLVNAIASVIAVGGSSAALGSLIGGPIGAAAGLILGLGIESINQGSIAISAAIQQLAKDGSASAVAVNFHALATKSPVTQIIRDVMIMGPNNSAATSKELIIKMVGTVITGFVAGTAVGTLGAGLRDWVDKNLTEKSDRAIVNSVLDDMQTALKKYEEDPSAINGQAVRDAAAKFNRKLASVADWTAPNETLPNGNVVLAFSEISDKLETNIGWGPGENPSIFLGERTQISDGSDNIRGFD